MGVRSLSPLWGRELLPGALTPGLQASRVRLGSGMPVAHAARELGGVTQAVVSRQARLKGTGLHWAPTRVDPMVALRTIVGADRSDEAWPQLSTRLRHAAHTRRRPRRPQPLASRTLAPPAAPPLPPAPAAPVVPSPHPSSLAPPAPKTIVDGRPTKAHPANRHFLTHQPAVPPET